MTSTVGVRQLRLLVAIASFGEKNLESLKKIIRMYQSMAMNVDIVVFSNIPKNLGVDVEVIVGLPSSNPWSLPFAHKPIFAQRVDQYDLFAYSEDDMEVTENNIHAFLQAMPWLEAAEIAGFLRYEVDQSGKKSLPDGHGHFHWKPESVCRRGDFTTAEFTNEHAAFYLLTQAQLKKAIASGGYLQGVHEGRHGLPETAATDPYTRCGFRKVICISHLEDFLIHHMSNFYVNRHDLSLSAFKEQIETLVNIRDGSHPATTLCRVESELLHGRWSKNYYEKPSEELMRAIPADAKTILSIGCGWGATEAALKKRGSKVTALPLDSVIGAVAARHGIEVIYGKLDEGLRKLDGREFDCLFISGLLHLQPDPGRVLERCSQFVAKGGALVMAGPNFNRMPLLIKRVFGASDYRKLRCLGQNGINFCSPGSLTKNIRRAGLRLDIVKWRHEATMQQKGWAAYKKHFGWLTAEDWIIRARREQLPPNLALA
ncbi:MAG: methyltransferase domain-containing protein [Verrucomicrobiales bacterium]|nr:methyltransferase domain-containing protein [Verrucomicrobiales bacterium]